MGLVAKVNGKMVKNIGAMNVVMNGSSIISPNGFGLGDAGAT